MAINPQALRDEAQRLRAYFYEHADEIEQARRVPKEFSVMLADAGFYALGVPEIYGGLEAPPSLSNEIFEILAQGDASAGWIAFIGMTSGTALAGVKPEVAQAIFDRRDVHMAGVFAPTGTAQRTEDGFIVNGRWQWGSGTQNADWVLGGCMIMQDGEPVLSSSGIPKSNMMIMPAHEIQFLDTWHVSGLKGTGSLDFEANDLFVPTDYAVGFSRIEPLTSALYKFPNATFLASGIGAVCLGIARAAIDEFVAVARSKKRANNNRTIGQLPHTHMQLASAEAKLRSARAFYYESLDHAWQVAKTEPTVGNTFRRDVRLATTNAVNMSVEVVDAMYTLAGGTSVYQSSRLQRYFRDVHVATQHIMVGAATMETAGRLFIDEDADVGRF